MYTTYRHIYIYIRDIILYIKTYSIGYNMKMDYFTKNSLVRCSQGRPDLDFSDAGPNRHGWVVWPDKSTLVLRDIEYP